jgi:Protein of unknown function (DUF4232)
MTLNADIIRNSVTGGIVAATAILAVGCGSHSSTAPDQPTGSASAASSSASAAGTATSSAPSQATTPAATASGPQTSAAPAGTAACATSNLRISLGNGGAAAGTDFTIIDFTNSGSTSCTLYGFPGVSLTNSSGAQIGAAATRNPSTPASTVTLAPGGKANAQLGVGNALNYPTADCKPASSAHLKVFPPGQTQSIEVAFSTTGCTVVTAHQLSVSAVTAGVGQQG